MLNNTIKASIQGSVLCWLATVGSDGMPNVSPKEIFASFGDESLIIANIASPQSVKNVEFCSKVCVSFVDVFIQKGCKIKGEAQNLLPGVVGYDDRYSILHRLAGDRFPIKSIIDIRVLAVSPIIAPSYWLFPDVTEQQQVHSACKTYGVIKAPVEHCE